ncbi:MAG: flagellar protein FliS [Ignavibacteriaceae bacterium]
MCSTTFVNRENNRTNRYLIKEMMEAAYQQIKIKTYDLAIINCRKKDIQETNNAIQDLINDLSIDDENMKLISSGMIRLCQFCQDQMTQKNYDMVLKILTDLKEFQMKQKL